MNFADIEIWGLAPGKLRIKHSKIECESDSAVYHITNSEYSTFLIVVKNLELYPLKSDISTAAVLLFVPFWLWELGLLREQLNLSQCSIPLKSECFSDCCIKVTVF